MRTHAHSGGLLPRNVVHAGEHLPVQFREKIVPQIYSSDPESEVPIYHPPQITQDIPAKTGGNVTFAFNWRKYSTTGGI